jgi:methylmalonyl-CoA mutase
MATGTADLALAADFEPATREAWLKLVAKAIKGADFEKRLVSRTADGLRVEPLYTREQARPEAERSVPGAAPFTRGAKASRAGWDIRQFYSAADPQEANVAILRDLEGGASSIALHIASPGTSGLPLAADTLEQALEGVLLDLCPIALIAGERTSEAAAALDRVWDKRGIAPEARLGHYNADPLGTLAQTGALTVPLEEALADAVGLLKRSLAMPGVTALLADGNPYNAGGASEAQELAAMLATLVAYLRAAEAAGVSPDRALPKIAVALGVDDDQFLSTAKLRAARRLVWRVAEACGAGAAAAEVHITAVTAWRMLAKRDPWTNIMRTTIACAAAAFGGADAIVVLPFTYALGRTDRFARRLARNIQIVCQEESHLGRVVDPAGGSWYVESLTDDLARKAWELFQDIERRGGMAAALQTGAIQNEIARTAEARAKAIATGRIELTGVSTFPLLGGDGITVEPWPKAAAAIENAAVTVPRLWQARLAEPFEALRDAADAAKARTGHYPQVFLASLGEVIDHNTRSRWVANFLATGGIEALTSDGYASPEEAAAAFRASGAVAACICSSDALYAAHAEATVRALKAAGAKLVLLAGRPGEHEPALRAAGVDGFLTAGQDAIEVLGGLQEKLG